MGTFLSCLRSNFDHDDGLNGDRPGEQCCQQCCCFPSCCGMYAVLFPASEDLDTALSTHSSTPSQSTALLDGNASGSSVAIVHSTCESRYSQSYQRAEKSADRCMQSDSERPLVIRHSKDVSSWDEDKKSIEDLSKSQQHKRNGKVDPLAVLVDDEDICPTCLEGYDNENPKIDTKCGHHFHLSCILEWMERSSHCPVCYEEMVFNESP